MSTASAGRDQPRRASNHDNSFKTQQDEGTKFPSTKFLFYLYLYLYTDCYAFWDYILSFVS